MRKGNKRKREREEEEDVDGARYEVGNIEREQRGRAYI